MKWLKKLLGEKTEKERGRQNPPVPTELRDEVPPSGSFDKKENKKDQDYLEEEEVQKAQENYSDIIKKNIEEIGKKGKYQSEVRNLQRFLLFSLSVNAGLFIIMVLFSVSFASVLNNRDVSILIPPAMIEDKKLFFGSTRVSQDVVEIYSDYLAREFGNFNYEDVDKKYDTLVLYADGSIKHQFRALLEDKKRQIIENFVTQTFKLKRIEIKQDREGILAKCYGTATRKVGRTVQFENLPYLMQFSYKTYRGNLSLVGMSSSINREPDSSGAKSRVDQYEKDNAYVNFQN